MIGHEFDDELDEEEREILEYVERGEVRSVPGVEHRIEEARQMALRPPEKITEVSLPLNPRERQGLPYKVMISSAVHRYLNGMMRDEEMPDPVTRNTLKDSEMVTLRLNEDNLKIAREMAEERGTTYQALVCGAVYRYLAGQLVDRPTLEAVAGDVRGA